MSNLDDLRAIVRKKRAAVTAKENRIKRNTGVDLKGTKDDPRRPPSIIKKYNETQLKSYLKNLDNFLRRDNGYVADASGGLIPKREWLKYKRAERKYNKVVIQHYQEIADIKDPYRNVTIREAEALYVPNAKRAQGEIRHRPYNEINRDPRNIKSRDALAKLQAQIDGKLDKGYLPKAIAAGRDQANKMLDNAGLSKLKTALGKLSDKQFNVLWNYWGFATRLSQIGASDPRISGNIEDKSDRLSSQEKDSIKEDITEFIDSAKALPLKD